MASAPAGADKGISEKGHSGRRQGADGRKRRTGDQRAGAGTFETSRPVSDGGLLDSGEFFQRNGLLFASAADVRKSAEGLARKRSPYATLAGDPSLRGIMKTLSSAAEGVEAGRFKLDQLAWPLTPADRTLSDVLAGKPATFSWQELLQGHRPAAGQLRHFIERSARARF